MGIVEVYRVRTTFRDLKRRGFFAEEEDSGDGVMTSDARGMALYLYGKGCEINYDGSRREVHTYLDGYFGRPLVPADAFLLRRLYRREISDLEREMAKAEAALSKRTIPG